MPEMCPQICMQICSMRMGALAIKVLVIEAIQGRIELHRHWAHVNAQRIQLCHEVTIDLCMQA